MKMAKVSSLLRIPKYRSFVVIPVTILQTSAAVTNHRPKSRRLCCSVWDSVLNFHRKNNSRAFTSDSPDSLAVTSTLSTPSHKRYFSKSILKTEHIRTAGYVICYNYLYAIFSIYKTYSRIETGIWIWNLNSIVIGIYRRFKKDVVYHFWSC